MCDSLRRYFRRVLTPAALPARRDRFASGEIQACSSPDRRLVARGFKLEFERVQFVICFGPVVTLRGDMPYVSLVSAAICGSHDVCSRFESSLYC